MSFSDNLKKNLNPGLLSDPMHVTLFVALKHLFDAPNYNSLDGEERWAVLSQLTKASRYEEEPDIFLSKKARDMKKPEKLMVFRELFELAKSSLMAMAENPSSSFYCAKCIGRTEEMSGIYDYISDPVWNPNGRPDCSHNSELIFGGSTKIILTDFLDNKIQLDIFPSSGNICIKFSQQLGNIKANTGIKTKTIMPFLRYWLKTTIGEPSRKITRESGKSANMLSIDVSPSQARFDFSFEKINMLYDLGALSQDNEKLFQTLKKSCDKRMCELTTIASQEKKISELIKKNNFGEGVPEFMAKYYPDLDPKELVEYSLFSSLYSEAVENLTKNAEIRYCDLPGV